MAGVLLIKTRCLATNFFMHSFQLTWLAAITGDTGVSPAHRLGR